MNVICDTFLSFEMGFLWAAFLGVPNLANLAGATIRPSFFRSPIPPLQTRISNLHLQF